MSGARRWLFTALVALAGCDPSSGALAVSVITDLEPGADFIGVEVEVFQGADRVGHQEAIVAPGDWTRPTPLADVVGLAPGRTRVVATLLAPRRDVVVSRAVMIDVESAHALVIVLSSSCVRVECPGPGDPADATTCAGGLCVAPDCGDDCGCASDRDCPASAVCGAGRCASGTCIYPDGARACPEGDVCHPARGCVAASCACDDGDPCTVDLCEGSRCVHRPREGAPCDDGVFCNGPDRCDEAAACVNAGPPPCALAACDEAAATCIVGCETDADCPAEVLGSWSECEYADECAQGGERTRDVTRFTCVERRCAPQASVEAELCTRVTEWSSCGGGESCEPWTGCRFADCATSGRDARLCYSRTCRSGACRVTSREESTPCSRGSQDGQACASNTGYGYCHGTCAGATCADLCVYCDGFCSIGGCLRRVDSSYCTPP
ncbi:MAG: hypothetical protein KF729_00960 [Sandaracinaceae bacterium]|nr:hypothetical protein [Sandaracinaceae bacterium]